MSRPIQTQPSGLLGFLQLKNMGKNPAELPDSLQAVLEMREWFWETNSQDLLVGGNITPLTGSTTGVTLFTVPSGFYWALLDVSYGLSIGAGDSMEAALVYRAPQGGVQFLNDLVFHDGASAGFTGVGRFFASRSNRIVLLPPGTTIELAITRVTNVTGALAAQLALRYTALQV